MTAPLRRIFFGKFENAGKWILAALLLSCIFIPRLSLKIGGTFRFDLRMEDFLLLPLIFLFFSGSGQGGRAFRFVEKSFLLFFLATSVSVINGIWQGTLDKPVVSLFYILKWAEYFLIFSVAAFFAAGRENSRFLLKIFFILGLGLACYGYWETAFPSENVAYPNYYRLYERFPFFGDSNHVSGLIVLWIAFFTGIYLKSKNPLQTGILAAALLLIFPPFLLSYSRKSYFALGAALLPAFFIKGSRRRLLFLVLCYVLIALLLPSRVLERVGGVAEALSSADTYNSSWAHNVESWELALWNFKNFWLFGAGFAARHRIFYESQYLMVLTETGFTGFFCFLALIFSPLRGVLAFWPAVDKDPEARGIAWGWVLGFTGMLVHNISCISWSIVKVAMPWWFLAGAVLSYLAAAKQEEAVSREAFCP